MPPIPGFDPKKLEKDIFRLDNNLKKLDRSIEGKEKLSNIADFTYKAGTIGRVDLTFKAAFSKAASDTVDLIRMLPVSLFSAPESPVYDQKTFLQAATEAELNASLLTLYLGTQAMILADKNDMTGPDYLLQAAFGRDKASFAIRDQLIKPFGPSVEIPFLLKDTIKQLEVLLRDGNIREWLATGRKCGSQPTNSPKLWSGKILSVTMTSPCTGGAMTIQIADYKSSPNLVLGLPLEEKQHRILDIESEIIQGNIRKVDNADNTTSLTLTLPPNITSGDIYFQDNVPDNRSPECINFWSVMDGPAPQLKPISYPITAGRPVIHAFSLVQPGPVFPRQYIDLTWWVENADNVSLEIIAVPGSPNPDELPQVLTGNQLKGTLHIDIPCTRRWTGMYALHATNTCGMAEPVIVLIESGWSHFLIGTGIADITDTTQGLGMQGFADELQKSIEVETPLFSRAFIIAKNKLNPVKTDCTVFVVLDIWSCTQAIKTAVVNRLNAQPGLTELYTQENIMISGTHTHSGPGGYSHYFLYNLTCGGFDADNFDKIVDGIIKSIRQAHNNLARGRIFMNSGEVEDCGMNRSKGAYNANRDAASFPPIDKEMLLLRFEKDVDNHGNPYPVGVLNWYAIHPTNRGQANTLISGDNKGWASHLFEMEKRTGYTYNPGETFVAGFANSCAGDISGSVVAGNVVIPHSSKMDIVLMKNFGNIQYLKAKILFQNASEELTGDIVFRYKHLQMSGIAIENDPPNRTWPAALGISFGAGSTEDGKASTFFKELGIKIPSPIGEGITTLGLTFIDIAAIALAIELLPAAAVVLTNLAIALSTGVGIDAAAKAFIVFLEAIPVAAALPLLDILPYLIPLPIITALAFGGLKEELSKNPLPSPDVPWNLPSLQPLNASTNLTNGSLFIAGHEPKPIMFPVGICEPYPLVPNKVPIQLIKIGQLAVAGVPGEFTTMAGRRLKATLQNEFGNPANKIVVANYTNAYSGYTTTEEEYKMQHYEGASTLYGPQTLEAYRQEFSKLAIAITNGIDIDPGCPEVVNFVHLKQRGIRKEMIYVNNRTNSTANIRIFLSRIPDRLASFNWLHENVPANENLLFTIPGEPFEVSVNFQPCTPQKAGGIITIQ